jgi:spore germination protein YaaH
MTRFLKKSSIIAVLLTVNIAANTDTHIKKWGYAVHFGGYDPKDLTDMANEYDIICVTGFFIRADGTIDSPGQTLLNNIAAVKKRAFIYPMLSFKSSRSAEIILRNPKLRIKTAAAIKKTLISLGSGSLHLDFEYIRPVFAVELSSFICQIKNEISPLKLTMAVFPPVDFPHELNSIHMPEKLAPCADEAVVMCYDLHSEKTKAGPVTDLSWAEKNIIALLRHFKPSKIWLGVPAYGYSWRINAKGHLRAAAVSARQAVLSSQKHAIRHSSGTLLIKTNNSTMFVSDKVTRNELTGLTRKFGLAGTALWRIGFED